MSSTTPTNLSLDAVLNKRYALRKLLENTSYHFSDATIPKSAVLSEKEPHLHDKLWILARQIKENPETILVDQYTLDQRIQDWNALVKKEVIQDGDIIHIDTRSRPGHKILDHHMPHFFEVKNHKGISVKDLCTQERLEKALLTNLCMHTTPYKSEIRRMILMTGGLGNVTKYRAVTTKGIVEYFRATSVFDPCIGWGGRMLGALASKTCTRYVGCEPDPKTFKGLQGILQDPAIPQSVRNHVDITSKPVEEAFTDLATIGKFDMILTSPPYYNLEVYQGERQSIQKYPTWEEWIEKWLKPMILGCLALVKNTGTSCWSVKNFRSDKSYNLADIVKQIHKDAGWNLTKTVKMTGSARPGAKRIKGGKEVRESEEDTYCFKKTVS